VIVVYIIIPGTDLEFNINIFIGSRSTSRPETKRIIIIIQHLYSALKVLNEGRRVSSAAFHTTIHLDSFSVIPFTCMFNASRDKTVSDGFSAGIT